MKVLPGLIIQRILIASIFLFATIFSFAQKQKFISIDPEPFADASHHWYDIAEKGNIINAKPGQPVYNPRQIINIANNILLYQKKNGGWPKNYDMFAILTGDQKDSIFKAKDILNTTFDNGTTYTHIAALASVYTATQITKYRNAALKGLDYILTAQYKNGGWPQYYPLEENYSRHITYNDGAMEGIMQLLKNIVDNKPEYLFVDENHRKKIKAAYENGLNCILKTQIIDNGKPTAWCQQHDEVTLQPAWGRAFEPASICNGESSDIVLFLMSINKPSKEIIDAVDNAVAWFKDSKIYNTRIKTIKVPEMVTKYRVSNTDKIAVIDSTSPPIWTHYYELKIHRPLFCNRDSKVVYSLAEVDRERRDGYGWYTYSPQKVLNKYPAWKKHYSNDKSL